MKPNKSTTSTVEPWLAVAVTAAFFVPLGVFGAPGARKERGVRVAVPVLRARRSTSTRAR